MALPKTHVATLVEATAVLVVSQLLILNKYLYINKRINTKGCIFLAPFQSKLNCTLYSQVNCNIALNSLGTYLLISYINFIQLQMVICKSRNGESGKGMRGMIGTPGIRVGRRGIRVGMRRISVILCENLRVYCFG